MARFVRDLLGIPKAKGSDDHAPDDPPWPDVEVVVIVNKRSGGRAVGRGDGGTLLDTFFWGGKKRTIIISYYIVFNPRLARVLTRRSNELTLVRVRFFLYELMTNPLWTRKRPLPWGQQLARKLAEVRSVLRVWWSHGEGGVWRRRRPS